LSPDSKAIHAAYAAPIGLSVIPPIGINGTIVSRTAKNDALHIAGIVFNVDLLALPRSANVSNE
jgi:hypothetical protein